jgi:hypothetical protein
MFNVSSAAERAIRSCRRALARVEMVTDLLIEAAWDAENTPRVADEDAGHSGERGASTPGEGLPRRSILRERGGRVKLRHDGAEDHAGEEDIIITGIDMDTGTGIGIRSDIEVIDGRRTAVRPANHKGDLHTAMRVGPPTRTIVMRITEVV